MSSIATETRNAWTSGRKTSSNTKGWLSGNAPCCIHNGETLDTRGRGGLIFDTTGGVTFHCFNCQFSTGYKPGHRLGYKFRKFLSWIGVDDGTVYKLSVDALREKERQELLGIIEPDEPKEEIKLNFKPRRLPELSTNINEPGSPYTEAIKYVDSRAVDKSAYDFYATTNTKQKMDKRVIVPLTWNKAIIGYTARAMVDGIFPKYITEVDSDYVFNFDRQGKNWKFVILTEGIFDAISIDGVATMGSNLNEKQIRLVESLDRDIIVVPDKNVSGGKLIDLALANHWSVSFPVWAEDCEDINAATVKYGKLFTLKAILDGVEQYKLKIEILRRKYVRN